MKTTSKIQLITALVAMLFITSFASAQVVVSDNNATTGNSSAVLDIISGSGDKGLLIPRVSIPSLLAAAPVSSPATGLLVYNTNGTTGPGFFYWNGSAWTALSGSIASESDPVFTAWDKDYDDLTNKPTIPTVPTNVSAFTNDASYLTSYTETDPVYTAWDKDYDDLTNKPTILNSQWTTSGSDIYYNTGNVGIGTATPVNRFEVSGSTFNRIAASVTADVQSGFQIIRTAGANDVNWEMYTPVGSTNLRIAKKLPADPSSTDILTFQDNGNVGIGTTTPTYKLEVNGNIKAPHFGLDGTGYFQTQTIDGSTADVVIACDANDFFFYERESDFYQFNIGGAAKLRIQANGNVGIGTEAPDAPLHVNGAVGINGNNTYFFGGYGGLVTTTSNFNMSIHASNDIVTNGGFVATSDKRVKENITELHNSLDVIGKLRPVSYNKIDKVEQGNRINYGFIAQEVEEVIPNAVNTGTGEIPVLKPFELVDFEDGVSYTILVKNGDKIIEQKYTTSDLRPEGEIIVKSQTVNDFKSITYDMIFTIAVDAIQEQQEEIERLQNEVEILKLQNAELSKNTEYIKQLSAEVDALKEMFGISSNQSNNEIINK